MSYNPILDEPCKFPEAVESWRVKSRSGPQLFVLLQQDMRSPPHSAGKPYGKIGGFYEQLGRQRFACTEGKQAWGRCSQPCMILVVKVLQG